MQPLLICNILTDQSKNDLWDIFSTHFLSLNTNLHAECKEENKYCIFKFTMLLCKRNDGGFQKTVFVVVSEFCMKICVQGQKLSGKNAP